MYHIVDGKIIKIVSFFEVDSKDIEDNIKSVEENIAKLKKNGKQTANEERRLEVYKNTLAEVKKLEAELVKG